MDTINTPVNNSKNSHVKNSTEVDSAKINDKNENKDTDNQILEINQTRQSKDNSATSKQSNDLRISTNL